MSNLRKTSSSDRTNSEPAPRSSSKKKKNPIGTNYSSTEMPASENQEKPINISSNSKIKVAVLTSLFTFILIIVVAATAYLAWPRMKPLVQAYFPNSFHFFEEKKQINGLTNRINKLERDAQSRFQRETIITKLNSDRQKLSQSLADLIERIETIEQSIITVKKMAQAAANAEEVAKASRSLKALNDRLKKIEPGAQATGVEGASFLSRLETLEQSQPSRRDLSERLAKLEGFGVEAKKTLNDTVQKLSESKNAINTLEGRITLIEQRPQSKASKSPLAIILAVTELRNTVQKGDAFVEELNSVRTIAGSDPAVRATLMAIEKHAPKGIRTLSSLRNVFGDLAISIVTASKQTVGANWISSAIQEVSSLVKFRRINGNTDPTSAEALVAQSERYLSTGNLVAAVHSVEQLNGAAKSVAESWLASAKARLAAERVLASLHKHALSLLSSEKG